MTFLTLFSVFVFIDINLKIPHKIMRTKKFIIFITASLLLSLLVSCISYSTSLFPSQVLSQSSNLQKKILRFIGTQEPKIQVFKGAQWGTETLQRIFKDGNWVFYPDGKFSFTPSLNAHVRSEKLSHWEHLRQLWNEITQLPRHLIFSSFPSIARSIGAILN